MDYYFVEIVPVSGSQKTPAQIIAEVQESVVKHTSQDAMRFKIFGEQKIIFIAKDDEPEKVLADLDATVGGSVDVTTTPIRNYETFAEKILGVDKKICTPIATAFKNPQKLFLNYATINMPGMGMDEFLQMWKAEAESVLGPRMQGRIDFRGFKVVAKRAVCVFFNLPSSEAMDDVSYTVPFALHPRTADGLHITAVKELKPF